MPELDDDELFGTRSDDSYDDGDEKPRGGDDDDENGEEPGLEDQFDEEEKPAKAAAKGGEPKRDGKTVTLSAKEHRELLERIREKETEEAYWRGKAEAGGKGRKADPEDDDEDAPPVRKAKPAAAEDEDEDEADLLDAISKVGSKALKARGFVRVSDVEAMIKEQAAEIAEKVAGRKVSQATQALHSDAALMRQYPDLADEKSEFYGRVGKEVRDLVGADKSLAKSPAVVAMAARNVKLQLDLEARSKRQTDGEREWRKNKQTPRGGSRGGDGDGEAPLSPMMRGLLQQAGVSEKTFRQSAAYLKKAGRM